MYTCMHAHRTQEEMAHTCRGTVNLAGAFIDTIDATNFVITNGPQVCELCVSIRACGDVLLRVCGAHTHSLTSSSFPLFSLPSSILPFPPSLPPSLLPQVYYLRALNEVERQRWVTALALAKAKAIKNLESGMCCV